MRHYQLFQELTRTEAKNLGPTTVLLFPVGATEQHGPHLPVGTDHFAVEHIARAAAEVAGSHIPVVVAPTLPFGSSAHHIPFGGTMSLSTETYYRVVLELCEALILGDWRRIFILNGHGGNHEIIQLVARDLALKYPVQMAAASYWNIAWDRFVAAEAHVNARLPGHAGFFETSLVMALRPELIHEPRPQRDNVPSVDPRTSARPVRIETHGSWQSFDGYTDSPARATAERGRTFLEAAAQSVGEALVSFYKATQG
jgi:creatinine amidohydrolase